MSTQERFHRGTIRLARSEELDELTAIEMDAVEALVEAGVPFPGEPHPLPRSRLAECLSEGLLFVAADQHDRPVGFLAAEQIGSGLYIAEIDVLRRCQRQGIGRALIAKAIDIGRQRRLSAAMLTTDRFVAFNYPFYASLGFREPAAGAMPAGLAEILEQEMADGMGADRRVGMVLQLANGE